MVARTRARKLADQISELSCHPVLLAHVFSTLESIHGPDALGEVASVCRYWSKAVRACQQIDPDPDYAFGELRSGEKPLRFDRPHGAVFLPNGHVCVADCDNFRLQIVTRDGSHVRDVRLSGGTSCPTGVAIDDGYFFVIEHAAHRLSKLRQSHSSSSIITGNRICQAGGWGGGEGQLRHPWGVAVAKSRAYVTDGGNHRVCVFATDSLDFLFSFGRRGKGRGELHSPRGIVASETELFVADSLNHRLQVFSLSDGGFIRAIGGGESTSLGRFRQPCGLTLRNDRLYVAEGAGERLQVMGLDGLPMQVISLNSGPLSGICVDSEHLCVTALEGPIAIYILGLRSFDD